MGALIYSMMMSADGYVADENGVYGWGAGDEDLHRFVAEVGSSVGTYLYGRQMYDTMVYWETADQEPDQPAFIVDYARQWQACDKIVFSTSLAEPRSARTTIRRSFDADEIRGLKRTLDHDLTVDGPTLAAQALEADLVDELQLIISPILVGGGSPFFPAGLRRDLELLDERSFGNGTTFLRYRVVPQPEGRANVSTSAETIAD